MTTNKGLVPFIYDISEAEIRATIRHYRRKRPRDKRSDAVLRPLAVNSIRYWQMLKEND